MHVKTKRMAFLGLLLSLAMILVILGSVLEVSTLFFLAAASFCTGIAILEGGLGLGSGFFIAGLFLSLLLSPNKLYCLTYGGMSFYLLLVAFIQRCLEKWKPSTKKTITITLLKCIIFNIMYLPIIYYFPQLILPGHTLTGVLLIGVIAAGQIVWICYDYAFDYFMKRHWSEIQKMLKL